TAGVVEREHVLGAETLVDRELLAQHLQLCDQQGVAPKRELRLDPRLDGTEAQFFETPRLENQRKAAGHVGVRVAAPERERRAERGRRAAAAGRVPASAAASSTTGWNSTASTCSGSAASRYPPSSRTMTSPIAALRFETYVCSVERAPAVGSSPQTPSMSLSTETGLPTSAASSASTTRCFGPPSRTSTPSIRTSRGPRTRSFNSEGRYAVSPGVPSAFLGPSCVSLMRMRRDRR